MTVQLVAQADTRRDTVILTLGSISSGGATVEEKLAAARIARLIAANPKCPKVALLSGSGQEGSK